MHGRLHKLVIPHARVAPLLVHNAHLVVMDTRVVTPFSLLPAAMPVRSMTAVWEINIGRRCKLGVGFKFVSMDDLKRKCDLQVIVTHCYSIGHKKLELVFFS